MEALVGVGIAVTVLAALIGVWHFRSASNTTGAKRGASPDTAPGQSDSGEDKNAEHHHTAVTRAREAIRKIAGALEVTVTDMLSSTKSYGDALEGHKSTIEKGLPDANAGGYGTKLLGELASMQAANDQYRTKLDEANARIATQKDQMESLQEEAFVDFLTKIPNRRSLDAKFEEETYRAKRYKQPLALAFVDIDHFKVLNDTHGHQVGDRVLRGIAMKMQAALRKSDFLARYGGEEFAILLPGTTIGVAATVAEKLRSQLEHSVFRSENHDLRVTVSIGIGEYQCDQEDYEQFIVRVDAAMYRAKAAGRNRVEKAEPIVD